MRTFVLNKGFGIVRGLSSIKLPVQGGLWYSNPQFSLNCGYGECTSVDALHNVSALTMRYVSPVARDVNLTTRTWLRGTSRQVCARLEFQIRKLQCGWWKRCARSLASYSSVQPIDLPNCNWLETNCVWSIFAFAKVRTHADYSRQTCDFV